MSAHTIDERTPCADMPGTICREDRLLIWADAARNIVRARKKAVRRYIAERDQLDESTIDALENKLSTAAKTIFPVANFDDWPLDAAKKAIKEGDQSCLDFAAAHPVLSAEALEQQSTSIKKAPLAFELYRAVATLTVSFDQVHHFDDVELCQP